MKNWPTVATVFISGGLTSLGAEGLMNPTTAGTITALVGAVLTFVAHRLESPAKKDEQK